MKLTIIYKEAPLIINELQFCFLLFLIASSRQKQVKGVDCQPLFC
uniref:Aar2-like protein n=1 Tax=Siphoviridae sp. ctSqC25 TaxID=2823582 RepID=A0A8S5L6L7_9CAUD|nr:MAG TPA: Aar2-like protein [Siphoviridae sp. ctSqC25]